MATLRRRARDTAGHTLDLQATLTIAVGPIVNALANPSRYGYPDATNTGPRRPLVDHAGITTRTRGEVIEGYRILGGVKALADDVVVRDCDVRYTGTLYPVQQGDFAGLLLEHVRIDGGGADHPAIYSTGGRYRMLGCDVFGATDGARIEQNGVEILASYFHDQAHPAGAHADALQIRRGDGVRIVGNTLLAGRQLADGTWARNNAVLQYGSDLTAGDSYDDLWFLGNLCNLGNYMTNGPGGEDMRQRYEDNRFGRNWQFYLTPGSFGADDTWLRNVWDDTGALIPRP